MFRSIAAGLRRLFRKDADDRELDDEVAHYLELSTLEHVRAGLPREQAERAARVAFGGVQSAKERVRSAGWESTLETLWLDARYALRGLRRSPGFALVATLTLALGIGATTAMFSVVNAVMLRPLPYRDADRLALVWTDDIRRGLHTEHTSFATIGDWRAANHTLEAVAFYNTGRTTLAGAEGRERVRGGAVSGNLFAVLGVSAARGRVISTDDEAEAAEVAVISHTLWQRRFGGDSAIVGKTLTIENTGKDGPGVFRIIGVMPPAFYFPDKETHVWTSATNYWRFVRESRERFSPWARRWIALARFKPEASLADVQADVTAIGRQLDLRYTSDVPDFPGFAANVVPLLDGVAGKNLQAALWLLLGAVSLVLLVACANVANLLLARGATRQREFVLRRALGAGRSRLIRQLAVESVVLAIAGGALGVALALLCMRVLAVAAVAQVPRIDEITLDRTVLLFAALVSLAASVIFGVGPALRVSGVNASQALKEGGRSSSGKGLLRTRGLLVVAECALAVVLLAGAGLLLRSLDRLNSVDPGFDPHHVLSVRLEFPPESPPTAEERTQTSQIAPARARAREQVLNDLSARIAAIPGVETVGFIDDMFVSGQGNKSITIPGRSTGSSEVAGQLNDGAVTPGFFDAMRVPLRRGRYLSRDDALTKIRALWSAVVTDRSLAEKERAAIAEPVVVNEAFARRFFPDADPIGKRFCIDPTNKTYWYVIAGVIGDLRRQGLDQGAIPEYFGPFIPAPGARTDLLVRTYGDPLAVAPTVRQFIMAAFPGAILPNVSTADRELGNFSAARLFQTWLLTSFAVLALVLAAVGIYGVVHYTVSARAREIGVRMALGAAAPNVLRMVVLQGMRLPLAGIAIGMVTALGLTRVMTRLLFGTSAADPLTYAAVALTLGVVAFFACLAPARRAARLDPLVALRHE